MNLFCIYMLCVKMQTGPYFVCHTDGVITRKANNKDTIRLGAKITDADSLCFSPGSKLLAVNGKGVFEMADHKHLSTQRLPLAAVLVRDFLLPQTQKAAIYTKGGGAILNLEAMQDYLTSLTEEAKPRLLLVNEIRIQLNKQTFANRNKNYFFLRYLSKRDAVSKKLPYIEPALPDDPLYVSIPKGVFNKSDTASIKGMQLYYRFDNNPESVLVSDLTLTLISREDLLAELTILVQEQGTTSAVEAYLLTNYGWIDRETLHVLFPELYR